MNWGEMKTLSRLHLNDPSGKVWPDVELLSYMTESIEDFTVESEANLHRIWFPLISGQRAYTLPENCYEVRTCRINGLKAFGTTPVALEDLDATYLTATGTPEWYYMEDLRTIAFYPIPTWTDSYTSFTTDDGVLIQWSIDGTNATFTSEDGVLIDVLDTSGQTHYITPDWDGVIASVNTGGFVVELSYIYAPEEITLDADIPDVPTYVQYGVMYNILALAFGRDGPAKNVKLRDFYAKRAEEIKTEWFARNLSVSKGQDQYLSQEPVTWGSDLDWRMRTWP